MKQAGLCTALKAISEGHVIILFWEIYGFTIKIIVNTPGTAGGPGGRDRMLAVKSRKTAEKITFFS